MANTVAKISVNNTWQSANALSGIAAGAGVKVQLLGGVDCLVCIAASKPVNDLKVERLSADCWYAVATGESTIWIKTMAKDEYSTAQVSLQAN